METKRAIIIIVFVRLDFEILNFLWISKELNTIVNKNILNTKYMYLSITTK